MITAIPSQSSRCSLLINFRLSILINMLAYKVLSGTIHAYYFDSLDSPDGPHQIGEPVVLNEGDVTWIADQHYQVHQLRNLSMTGRICCTLQCYQCVLSIMIIPYPFVELVSLSDMVKMTGNTMNSFAT